MAIYTKDNPVGIDAIIHTAQKNLFEKLSQKWGNDIDAYPRCYVIEREDDNGVYRSIEHYKGNNEYTGTLITSEGNKFFFMAENEFKRVSNTSFETKVDTFFILNLRTVYKDINHRSDAEVINDIYKVLNSCFKFYPVRIITDYRDVFNSFNYRFDNIQPYLILKIESKVVFDTNQQVC